MVLPEPDLKSPTPLMRLIYKAVRELYPDSQHDDPLPQRRECSVEFSDAAMLNQARSPVRHLLIRLLRQDVTGTLPPYNSFEEINELDWTLPVRPRTASPTKAVVGPSAAQHEEPEQEVPVPADATSGLSGLGLLGVDPNTTTSSIELGEIAEEADTAADPPALATASTATAVLSPPPATPATPATPSRVRHRKQDSEGQGQGHVEKRLKVFVEQNKSIKEALVDDGQEHATPPS